VAKTKVVAKRTARVSAPQLALVADRPEVRKGETIRVAVEMSGLDEVTFSLEPARKVFSLDLASMKKPGAVRLKGEGHGFATLIASGRKNGVEVVKRMVHVRCQGPRVGILVFGYLRGGK
jgi:hypothetical protein